MRQPRSAIRFVIGACLPTWCAGPKLLVELQARSGIVGSFGLRFVRQICTVESRGLRLCRIDTLDTSSLVGQCVCRTSLKS